MNKKAFTLVELLVVIGILAILMAIFMPGIAHLQGVAKATKTREIAVQVAMAWEAYVGDARSFAEIAGPKKRHSDYKPEGFAMSAGIADALNGNKNSDPSTREIDRRRDPYFERSPIQTKFGILSAWGLARAQSESVTGPSDLAVEHFIWAKLDEGLEGFVIIDVGDDGEGTKVRKPAIAWAAHLGKPKDEYMQGSTPSTQHIRSW